MLALIMDGDKRVTPKGTYCSITGLRYIPKFDKGVVSHRAEGFTFNVMEPIFDMLFAGGPLVFRVVDMEVHTQQFGKASYNDVINLTEKGRIGKGWTFDAKGFPVATEAKADDAVRLRGVGASNGEPVKV